MGQTRIIVLLAVTLALGLAATASLAEIRVKATDGRTYTIPLEPEQIESIEIRSANAQNPDIPLEDGGPPPPPPAEREETGFPAQATCGYVAYPDSVVMFIHGDPGPGYGHSDPNDSLGPPDSSGDSTSTALSLGCGGALTLALSNAYLVDVDGPDMRIHEVGSSKEAMLVEISADGVFWVNCGVIDGGVTEVDINPYVRTGQRFTYIRITDRKTSCSRSSGHAGADIDSVEILGCAK